MSVSGLIHVYTGNGKGKSTAAIGLAIRALGAGKKVIILQFMKEPVYSEHRILPTISARLAVESIGRSFFVIKKGTMPEEELAKWRDQAVVFPPGELPCEYLEQVAHGLKRAKEVVTGEEFEVVIFDEIIVALHFGLITWLQMKELLDKKGKNVELILTGRGAPSELLERADLVTEMQEIKHYYTQGISARKGIDC